MTAKIKIRHLIGWFIGASPRSDNNGGSYISLIHGPSRELLYQILHGNERNRSKRFMIWWPVGCVKPKGA